MRDAPLADILQLRIKDKPITDYLSKEQIVSLAIYEPLADLSPKPSPLQQAISALQARGRLHARFSDIRIFAQSERKRLRREFLVDGIDLPTPERPAYFEKLYADIQAQRARDPLHVFRSGKPAMPLWAELIFSNNRNRKDDDYIVCLSEQIMPDGSYYPPGTPLLHGSNLKTQHANTNTPHNPVRFTQLLAAERKAHEINHTLLKRTDVVFPIRGSRMARAFYLDEGIINPDAVMALSQPFDREHVREAEERAHWQRDFRLNTRHSRLHPTGLRSFINLA